VLVAAFARGGFDFGASYLTDWIGQRVMTDLRTSSPRTCSGSTPPSSTGRRAADRLARHADVALVRGSSPTPSPRSSRTSRGLIG